MTSTRASATFTVLSVTMLISACGGGSQSPTSPTPSATNSTLSGVVFEIVAGGNVGVEGVEVYCDSCGPVGHSHRFTDGTGAYDFGEVAIGNPLLVLSKPGYTLARPVELYPGTGWMGAIRAPVRGQTEFNIEIVRQ
jgi:hypothetical protein